MNPFTFALEGVPISDKQREAADIIISQRGGIAWWKPGEGKSRIALLAFICYPFKFDETSHLLIFCRPEAFTDWHREAEIMGIGDRIVTKSHASLSQKTADATVRDVVQNPNIGMVIFDELYLYKNPRSLKSEHANAIAQHKPCIGLSGSVMTSKDITDIYGQCFAVGKSKRLAKSLTDFRSQYMIGINNFGGLIYTPQRGAYVALMSVTNEFAHVHMPKANERTIHEANLWCDETSQQEALIQEMRDCLTLDEYGIEISNAAVAVVKLQQIANGWIEDSDGRFHLLSSNKAARCIAQIEELIEAGQKVIVWCAFRNDVSMLSGMSASKFKSLTMLGGKPFDLKAWESGKYPVVFATEATGVSINYFKAVPYAIYFSMSPKWMDYQQSRARTHRKDSPHSDVYYYYTMVRNSLDENILRRVRQSGSAESAMLLLAGDLQDLGFLKKETGGSAASMRRLITL